MFQNCSKFAKTIVSARSKSILMKSNEFSRRLLSTSSAAALETEISSYYGSSNATDAYQVCWGEGNIHLGYFPHLSEKDAPKLSFSQAAHTLTQKMGQLAGINHKSNVIDFGCGMGGPAVDLVKLFDCKVTGLDLTPEHIEICKQYASKQSIPESKIDFVAGSFTDLPSNIKSNKYTHCFSQLAVYHIAEHMQQAIDSAYSILDNNGVLIWCDFTGCVSGITDRAKEHFYNRLHLNYLANDGEYAEKLTKAGFQIEKYVLLGDHCEYGYQLLENQARKHQFKSKDGAFLADNYKATHELIKNGEVGMNVIVARKVE